jgi:hypothetical protein
MHEQQAVEQCRAESQKTCWHYVPGVFRERFVSPFEQYADRVGQRFTVVRQTQALKPAADEEDGAEDMYLIRFEDGTEIEAFGHEVCVWDAGAVCGNPCYSNQ